MNPRTRPKLSVLLLTIAFFLLGAAPTTQPVTSDMVLQHLSHVIDWYRRVSALDQSGLDPQEYVFRETARQNATQTLRLAFEFARAQANFLVLSGQSTSTASAGQNTNSQNLNRAATDAAARQSALQNQLDQVNQQLASKTATSRPLLEAQRDKLTAALNLASAQREVIQQYAGFVASTHSSGESDLLERIDELERSVPELQAPPEKTDVQATTAAAVTATAQGAVHPESSGVMSLISQMFSLTSRMSELRSVSNETAAMRETVDRMRQPVRGDIVTAVHRGQQISAPTTQPTTDPATLGAQGRELDALATRFRDLAAIGVPLGEESALLERAHQNLEQWRNAQERQYVRIVRALLIRIIFMVVIILVLVIASELWRRATYRYVTDARRRRQLMLVRRIVISSIVVLILIGGVVTEFGSLATFAGLITAGIAVALQTVILSGVAYFFFIGRFGVRVGDRVTISGISGDVIEVGLFRLYLTELAGKAPDLHPTGRIVVFSNAVLFQPSAFYKQIPGADYVWHEVGLTLAPDSDYLLAEKRVMAAVQDVFNTYRESIEQQFAAASSSLHVIMQEPRPQGHLRFVDAGVELVVRFPVEIRRAAEIDDQITRKLIDTIDREPKLKLVATKTPSIQSAA